MAIYLPLLFLFVQGAFLSLPSAVSAPAAYCFMVLGPLLAGFACAWRARRESAAARLGWLALALAMAVWAVGAFGNLWQEWVLGHVAEMYRSSMLAFNLSTVPIAFLLATQWRARRRRLLGMIDAALALALGYVYFLCTWGAIEDSASPGEPGVARLVWLIDSQNLFLTSGALVRWFVSQERKERELFRALASYSLLYLALAFVNDHFFAGNPALGPEISAAVTAAFALLTHFALDRSSRIALPTVPAGAARVVDAAKPVALAGALLIVSLFLIRSDYALGCAGVLVAVAGYGARSTVAQVRGIERSESLQRRHSELQAIAWTDALTGLANRHFLDQILTRAWRSENRAGHSLGILMIDIDHFKLLNDRCGHRTGDACLREVARVLQANLVRPSDVLARYGGEEFIALLRGVDPDGARVVAERLRTAVRDMRWEHPDSPLGVVTVSIGVVSAILDGETMPERLIDLADRALYEAKHGGRNQVRCVVDSAA
jgi:diguanylate cyclase (GGDEF)-like protein